MIITQGNWGVHGLADFHSPWFINVNNKDNYFCFFFPFKTQEAHDHLPNFPSSIEKISWPEFERPSTSFSYLSTLIWWVRVIFDQTKAFFKSSTFKFNCQHHEPFNFSFVQSCFKRSLHTTLGVVVGVVQSPCSTHGFYFYSTFTYAGVVVHHVLVFSGTYTICERLKLDV